jgi:hypothetical protein
MSMLYIGIGTAVISLIGTGISVYGQQQAADAAEDTAAFNATQQRLEASQRQKEAAENARRKQEEASRYQAAFRASLAASGLAMEGTPLAVLGEDASDLSRDILDIGYRASSESRRLIAGAGLSIMEGANAASSLRTQSYATAVKGVASAASGYGTATGYLG